MTGGAARRGVRVGVDVGSVRVGVARSDPSGLIATPVETVRRVPGTAADVDRIAAIVAAEEAFEVVVGLPRTLRGEEGSAAQAARQYATEIAERVAPIPVRLVDERLSTVSAHRTLHDAGVRGRRHRPVVDQVAAVVILQSALDAEQASGRAPGALVAPGPPPDGPAASGEEGGERRGGRRHVTEMSLSDVVPGSPQGPRRRSQRAAEKRRKRRKRRTWVTVLITVVVLGAAGGAAYFTLKPLLASFSTPSDFAGPGHGSVTVQIPAGATGSDIATILAKAGVVKTAGAFRDAAADTPGASSIQPGTYEMKLEMTGLGAVQALLDPQARQLRRVTIPEGTRLAVIFDKIASSTSITKAQLTSAAKDTAALGLPPEAHGNLEGYLWPATYDVEPTTTAADLLRDMVSHTTDQLDELGVAEKDRHRVLTLASLVQAEGRHPEDFGKIARVLTNRMAAKRNLELDTTLHYALNKFTVFTSNKDTQYASPYNTYLHAGLPPGPIDSPGAEALKAALDPTPGPWMYFVATDPSTGETKFAVTDADRQKLLAEYNAWQKAHPGQ